ncbi:hypothetical protein [Treponema sp.]|uniref:hypothetical protein n=1 Tax=Treponema sp. TaxID=166 RepID=UPI00388DF154
MKELIKSELFKYINSHRSGNLEEWKNPVIVLTEVISDSIFEIADLRGESGSIKRENGKGEATYYNSKNLALCFIRFEDFINQFRKYDASGKIEKDWTKGLSRPDYIAYDTGDGKDFFIIHELSSGVIGNKHKDGKLQLLNTVRLLTSQKSINDVLQNDFKERLCFLSARGCVEYTPNGNADSFMEIYKQLPDPLPINNKLIEKRNFKAFETKAIKL